MPHRRTSTVLVACLVAAAALSGPAAADAAEWSHRDRTGDVEASRLDPDGPQFWKVPDNRDTDITHATVEHSDTDVTVTLHVRDLRRRGTIARLQLVTPDDEFWATYLYSRRGGEFLFSSVDPDGAQSCAGATRDFRVGADVVEVVVPRSCLGEPDWIRTNVELGTWAKEDGRQVDLEDKLLGRVAAMTTPRLSPRILAGS